MRFKRTKQIRATQALKIKDKASIAANDVKLLIPEDEIVKTLVSYVKTRRLGEYLIHIANEGKRSSRQGAQLKAMGMTPGVSDLFLAYPNCRYAGFWLEVKAKGKEPSLLQLQWLRRMMQVGYATAWVDNIDDGMYRIDEYLALKNVNCLWRENNIMNYKHFG